MRDWQDERFEELKDVLTGSPPESVPALSLVTPMLRELLEADRALSYRVDEGEASRTLAFVYTSGFGPNRLVEQALQRFVPGAPRRFASYVPSMPAVEERNAVHEAKAGPLTDLPIYRDVFRGLGLSRFHRLRVLVCDGPRLLAWVGVFREDPFEDEQRELLARVTPLLRDRLLVEARLDESWLAQEALRASLDALPAAAFLITRGGDVRESNSVGRASLERDPDRVRADLVRSLEGKADAPYHVTEIARHGMPSHYLAVRRVSAGEAGPRIDVAAARWNLTPRQSEVLGLLAQGYSNRSISERLGCTEGTVGLHVSAILQKAAVDGRSELTARFWMLA